MFCALSAALKPIQVNEMTVQFLQRVVHSVNLAGSDYATNWCQGAESIAYSMVAAVEKLGVAGLVSYTTLCTLTFLISIDGRFYNSPRDPAEHDSRTRAQGQEAKAGQHNDYDDGHIRDATVSKGESSLASLTLEEVLNSCNVAETDYLLNFLRKCGACPSSARARRLREALNVYAFPSETMVARRATVTMDGRIGMLSRTMAMTLFVN